MKKEPGYKIGPVNAATRSYFATWILVICSLFRHDADKWIFEILWCVTYLYAE